MLLPGSTSALFLLPPFAVVALILVFCGLTAWLAWLLLFRLFRPDPARAPQGGLLMAAAGLFALFLSFAAGDAWRRGDSAYGALLREHGDAAALVQITEVAEAGADAMHGALRNYLRVSLAEEWDRFNLEGSEAASRALQRMRGVALRGLAGNQPRLWRVALDRVEGIVQARTARLVAGELSGDAWRWGGLLFLFALAMAAIALVHWDAPPRAAPAMLLYALVAAAALSTVAVYEQPYAGWDSVDPARLRALLARLESGL